MTSLRARRSRELLKALFEPFGAQADKWADALVDEYGTLAAAVAAYPTDTARLGVADRRAAAFLATFREAMVHALEVEIEDRPLVSSSKALLDYLFAQGAHQDAEHLRVLFLDVRNHLLRDEVMGLGTLNDTSIHPREIMKRALQLGAANLILVHNHPSGNPEPSKTDIAITRRIAALGREMEVRVLDHVVVARQGTVSLRELGLI